ncbi:hypothetical protein [Marinobacterium stanieri]|uniref:hypothetical protein n=1 Tax=Marinobacterium stanieri TaxID=49186 RepID=UPI0011119FCC|nr:hypothetical protein [Marinobacterium stanieri]
MQLLKDYIDDRICFYWSDQSGGLVSPRLATFQDAEEWWKRYLFGRYQGKERRRSIFDRRTNHAKRQRVADGAAWGLGRRITDLPVRVAHDLASRKVLEMRRMASARNGKSARP